MGNSKIVAGILLTLAVHIAPHRPLVADDSREKLTENEIRTLIVQLDDDDINKRNEATRMLCEAGEVIFPFLDRIVLEKANDEVKSRVRTIADATGWVPVSLRKKFLESIELFKSPGKEERARGLRDILAMGAPIDGALKKIFSCPDGTAEIATALDRTTAEFGDPPRLRVTIRNAGSSPLWICLPGRDIKHIGSASSLSISQEVEAEIGPLFNGFFSEYDTIGGGGGGGGGRFGGLIGIGGIFCPCNEVGRMLDNVILVDPGKDVVVHEEPLDNRLSSGPPLIAGTRCGYTSRRSSLPEQASFCDHQDAHGRRTSDIYSALKVHPSSLESKKVTFHYLPKSGDGEWGTESGGLVGNLRVEKTEFRTGEAIPLMLTLKNAGKEDMGIWGVDSPKVPVTIVVRDAKGEVAAIGVVEKDSLQRSPGFVPSDMKIRQIDAGATASGAIAIPASATLAKGDYTIFAVYTMPAMSKSRVPDIPGRMWNGRLITNTIKISIK